MPHNRASDPARRGVVDPRLSRYARATRAFIGASIAFGSLSALLIIAQAWLLASVIARAFGGQGVPQLEASLWALLAVVSARGALAWAAELAAGRCATEAKRQLRGALLERVVALGPARVGAERTGEITTLATRGIDALDGYFSLYLPQLLLAAIVPVTVVAVVLSRDWISAVIVATTLPLIPLFMALVGAATRDRTAAQLRTIQRLAGHFLDVVSGLPTLKVFGASRRQLRVIGEISDRHRVATIGALKVTFLSSLILEFVATVSVALVAVAVGLRLMYGALDLRTAMFVLVLAPEAYLPLRALGANYHASAEGLRAAEQVFEVLETPLPKGGSRTDVPDPSITGITLDGLTVEFPGRSRPVLDDVTLRVEPGEVLALTGRSGAGKSTLLNAILGFVQPSSGAVWIGDVELAELAPDAWRRQVSWLPQRPHVWGTTIEQNVRLGRPGADEQQVWRAASAAGLEQLIGSRPGGLQAIVGERGAALSAGERQRVALARAFLRDAPLVLLDEPTANLDGATEAELLAAIERLLLGRTAILVAHRPALLALAHRVVELGHVAVPA